MRNRPVIHPFEEDLGFFYGTIFVGPPTQPGSHSQNGCIFAEGEVDRSPTGTGVSGRLAIHHRRGEIKTNQSIVIESIIGSKFTGKVVRETTFGIYPAIIPEVEGQAHIIGRNELWINPSDPLKDGFILR
jgi:proline racemase